MAILGWDPQTAHEVALQTLRRYGRPVTDEALQKKLKNLEAVETFVTFEGSTYLVPNIAYYIPKVVQFPDGSQGRLSEGWLESMPPQGFASRITDQLFPHTDVYMAVPYVRA